MPLPNKEAQTLIKSIAKKTYNYKCKVPLISNQCDRISCMTLDYGMKEEDVARLTGMGLSRVKGIATGVKSERAASA